MMRRIEIEILHAPPVQVGEWQAIVNTDHPASTTYEIEDAMVELVIPVDPGHLQEVVSPNLPWAEDHFQERVGGKPLNPPPSNEWWPFAKAGNAEHKPDGEKFSHTYPERMWCTLAGQEKYYDGGWFQDRNKGIRFLYGDLGTLIT